MSLKELIGEHQENLTTWLMSIKDGEPKFPSYYAGGILCIDVQENRKAIMINLNETVRWLFSSDDYHSSDEELVKEISDKELLNTINSILAFEIYCQVKGVTDYFKKCLAKSHVRHLRDFLNKRYSLAKGE